MLQNELFQREVRAMLGDDFMMPSRTGPGAPTPGSAHRQASRTGTEGPSSANSASTDMGIMKALSSMGSATKRNISNLAQRFSAGSSSGNAQRRPSRNGETGNAREFRPLVESGHELDEDGDTEVIAFDSKGRQNHVLQSHEDDSENPLISQQQQQLAFKRTL